LRFSRILSRIRGKVKNDEYVLTAHAEEEMVDDGLTEVDIENAILNGRIVSRQRDALGRAKYIIQGTAIDDRRIQTVCRFSDSGNYIVIITVYEVI
jgi:hypothetical protein